MTRLGALLLLAVSGVLFPAGSRLHLHPEVTSLSIAVLDEEIVLVPLEERDGCYRTASAISTGPQLFRDDSEAACLRRGSADFVRFLAMPGSRTVPSASARF